MPSPADSDQVFATAGDDRRNVMNSENVTLSISGVSKSFRGLVALKDVSLSLRGGIITSLVGPNGAGKTTLFNAVTGHLRPDSGSVLFEGRPLIGLAPWKIARLGIIRSFQGLKLFSHMTVEENVLAAMEPSSWPWQPGGRGAAAERRERTAAILKETGLVDKAGVTAGALSYAEQKFLSLARLMAAKARLWLLDEPASGLDPSTYEWFERLLRAQVQQGISICIIEHNLDIITAISDRIAFLNHGQVIAEGSPEEILANPELIEIYFGGGAHG